jgi:hypothetical protein
MKKLLCIVFVLSNIIMSNDLKNEAVKHIGCIMHADFETPGVIQDWACTKGYKFTVCKPYAGDNCAVLSSVDCLIIMGGPQSACNLEAYLYLFDEGKEHGSKLPCFKRA